MTIHCNAQWGKAIKHFSGYRGPRLPVEPVVLSVNVQLSHGQSGVNKILFELKYSIMYGSGWMGDSLFEVQGATLSLV